MLLSCGQSEVCDLVATLIPLRLFDFVATKSANLFDFVAGYVRRIQQ